jgi:hypothetical protein
MLSPGALQVNATTGASKFSFTDISPDFAGSCPALASVLHPSASAEASNGFLDFAHALLAVHSDRQVGSFTR